MIASLCSALFIKLCLITYLSLGLVLTQVSHLQYWKGNCTTCHWSSKQSMLKGWVAGGMSLNLQELQMGILFTLW